MTAPRVPCSASAKRRTFYGDAWGGASWCPDCGVEIVSWVRSGDLYPQAKVPAHKAPLGANPYPYAVHPNGGTYRPEAEAAHRLAVEGGTE